METVRRILNEMRRVRIPTHTLVLDIFCGLFWIWKMIPGRFDDWFTSLFPPLVEEKGYPL